MPIQKQSDTNYWDTNFLYLTGKDTTETAGAVFAGLFEKNKQKKASELKTYTDLIKKQNHNKFGFFTPYRGAADFAATLVSPIMSPVFYAVLAPLAITLSVGLAITSLATLLFAAGPVLAFGSAKDIENTQKTINVCACLAAFTALASIPLAIMAVVSLPLAIMNIMSRTGASIIVPMLDCCADKSIYEVGYSGQRAHTSYGLETCPQEPNNPTTPYYPYN